jgi:heat-inducible transcriptional repressor
MTLSPLLRRYQHILRATIQHYIATAEPVGSKTLVEEYNFSVSSATIRNALGQLEKEGFLYQPHTSAGRIPSDDGYRIYVDHLLTPDETVGRSIVKHLNEQLTGKNLGFDVLFQRATKILAHLSGYIALITLPQTAYYQLRHVHLVQASSQQVMLIVVTDNYQTQSILMDLSSIMGTENIDSEASVAEELQILSNFLNHKLQGRSLSELATLDWKEMDQSFAQYGNFLKLLLQQINRCLQPTLSAPLMVHGVSEMLRQPEFGQLQQVQMLLHLLEEEQDQLLPLIWESPDRVLDRRVTVRIGAENPLESMRPCTLISAIYHQGDRPMGSVGVIGPTRMLYENAIPLVESMANYLSEALS